MNTRNVFATAALGLMLALAADTALAIASSGDHSGNMQNEATVQTYAVQTYPANPSTGLSDEGAPGAMSSPGESSEQSTQTYNPSDNADSSDANASEAPDSSATATSDSATVVRTEPAIVAAPDEPRYVPETGNAEYGRKLMPYDRTLRAQPPARFNDATGQ